FPQLLFFNAKTPLISLASPIVVVSDGSSMNNETMVIPGRVRNGVVVLESGPTLPEGAAVTVSYPAHEEPTPTSERRRTQVPLVRSERPGSVHLTGERIAQILDEEDASPRR